MSIDELEPENGEFVYRIREKPVLGVNLFIEPILTPEQFKAYRDYIEKHKDTLPF